MASRLRAAGHLPLPLTDFTVLVCESKWRQNMSPPRPVEHGSSTARAAFEAIWGGVYHQLGKTKDTNEKKLTGHRDANVGRVASETPQDVQSNAGG